MRDESVTGPFPQFLRDRVLRLAYISHDTLPFARDLGYHGPPFLWDQETCRRRRAHLDAVYFHHYGIATHDGRYTLSTLPIIQRQHQATFGTWRLRNPVLAFMSALAAGDLDTKANK